MLNNIWQWTKKKAYATWDAIKSFFSTAWEKTKDWSGWSTNGTILKARVTMAVGLITGAAGLMDWSPLLGMNILDTGFSWVQVAWLGGIAFAKGLADEITRRWNATDL